MTIDLINYTKVLKKRTVLDDINISFESGNIYGLSGKNGCGKTMLLRAVSGLILPTQGCVRIDNEIIGKDIEFPPSVGLMIDNMSMPTEYTALKNLLLLAKINRIATEEDVREALCAVGLDPDDKRTVKKYSLGMKQKLNIAQAIMEKPKILLLDEPTNALDDESVKRVHKVLLKFKEEGALIIIASHNKDDLNDVCDTIINIENGRICDNEKSAKAFIVLISIVVIVLAFINMTKPYSDDGGEEQPAIKIAEWISEKTDNNKCQLTVEIYDNEEACVDYGSPINANGFFPVDEFYNCKYTTGFVFFGYGFGTEYDSYATLVPDNCVGAKIDGIMYQSQTAEIVVNDETHSFTYVLTDVKHADAHEIVLIDEKGKSHIEKS